MRNRLSGSIAAAIGTLTVAVTAATLQNIAGSIVDSNTDERLPGVQVQFLDATNAELLASTTSDEGGNFDSGNIPTGNYRLRFPGSTRNVPEYYGAGGVDDFCSGTIVPVSASATTPIDARLVGCPSRDACGPMLVRTTDAIVYGTVVDAATGAPLEGILVSFLNPWTAQPIFTRTTSEGGLYALEVADSHWAEFRIRFTDPRGAYAPQFHGAGADAFCTAATVVSAGKGTVADGFLERIPPAQLTQQLADTVQSYNLPPDVATMLGTPLTHARKLLADDRSNNNNAACGQLGSFVTRVDLQERRGKLSAAEATELKRLSVNLQAELGCR